MGQKRRNFVVDDIIKASWERCEQQHRLVRAAPNPVLRLQKSEIVPRLDEVVERTGGRLGIFSELARLAMDAGQCLVVTDAEGVVVRFESKSIAREAFERNGIGLGSCWDERIAGTNGVSIAMLAADAVTVRGDEHYYRSLTPFACTAVPLLDARNEIIGAASFSDFHKGSGSDYLIAKKVLLSAAGELQRRLFQKEFADHTIISVSTSDSSDLLQRKGLVALDAAGKILGATSRVYDLGGIPSGRQLTGQPFESVFGADLHALQIDPGRMLSFGVESGPQLTFSIFNQDIHRARSPGRDHNRTKENDPKPYGRAPLDLDDIASGSHEMSRGCLRAKSQVQRGYPLVIQGESGTGKSALVLALRDALDLSVDQVTTLDCAAFSDNDENRHFMQGLCSQARAARAIGRDGGGAAIWVFDNIDELPAFAQSDLRGLLDEFERDAGHLDAPSETVALSIIATCRTKLVDAVRAGRFRDDLFFLLSGAIVELPPLRQREGLADLAQRLASRIAGEPVQITRDAQLMLAEHDWPGNVRELRNILQQALMEGNGRQISPVDLSVTVLCRTIVTQVASGADHALVPLRHVYDEKTMLLDTLSGTGWNVSEAARKLGIGRATINRKIKQYGLSRPH